ncbi:MAG: AAA family ATPase [Chitinispirillaceae bacterium]
MILIPYPCLVLLIGPAASGKTTFARTHFRQSEILSSDKLRAAVCDDQKDQSASADAFEILHLIASKRLARRKLTVIDATNVLQSSRKSILDLNRDILPTAAVLFDYDEKELIRQDLSRTRRVGADVIRMHTEQMKETLDSVGDEGYKIIINIRNPSQANHLNLKIIGRSDQSQI